MTLYRETLCEHGYLEEHYTCSGIGYLVEHTDENCHCPGGTREEFNPNIKAAVDKGYEVFHLNVLIEKNQLVAVNKALLMAVESAIAAALTPGDTDGT